MISSCLHHGGRGRYNNFMRYIYRGDEDEIIPREATHIFVCAKIIPRRAFQNHPNIIEVICRKDVEKIGSWAFAKCRYLRRAIMPGVKILEWHAFIRCESLEDVECGKLEIIGQDAFHGCYSLRSINLPSARIAERGAFSECFALTDVKFSNKLERFEEGVFLLCESLRRITIPLKDGMITADNIFQGCSNFGQVVLVDEELRETISALQLVDWKSDINEEIDSINQILPKTWAGQFGEGGKAQEIRTWIRAVLRKIIHYKGEHEGLLDEAAATLQVGVPRDIVMNGVLHFLELPSHTFEVEDESDDEEDDNVEAKDDGEVSEGDEVNDQNDDQNRHIFCCLRKWPCPMRKERD